MTIPETPAPDSLAGRQAALVATLSAVRDPQARFAWAVEQARHRPHLPTALRLDAHRVEGCQVRLWFVAEFRAGHCWFQTDSDAATLRAMCGLLADLASGAAPAELAAWQPDFLDRLGLLRQLAENRRATVLRVVAKMRAFAAGRMVNGE